MGQTCPYRVKFYKVTSSTTPAGTDQAAHGRHNDWIFVRRPPVYSAGFRRLIEQARVDHPSVEGSIDFIRRSILREDSLIRVNPRTQLSLVATRRARSWWRSAVNRIVHRLNLRKRWAAIGHILNCPDNKDLFVGLERKKGLLVSRRHLHPAPTR